MIRNFDSSGGWNLLFPIAIFVIPAEAGTSPLARVPRVLLNLLHGTAHLQWEIFFPVVGVPCGWCYHQPLESNFHSRKDAMATAYKSSVLFPCGWCYHQPLESNFHSRKDAKTQWLQLINHLFDLMFLRLCVSARAFIFPASARNSRALLNLIPGTRAALLAYPSR